MKKLNNNQQAFFALLKAGLWEKETYLLPYGNIDFHEIYRLAQEQSVVGIVAAGFEHVVDLKPPKEVLLTFVGEALLLEQRNTAMNFFIGIIVGKLQRAGIAPFLVKGQGIAQCYKRPLWRTSGDVDFFYSYKDYNNAVDYLKSLASIVDEENPYNKHIAMTIDSWVVEAHGTMRSGLWQVMDDVLDIICDDIFSCDYAREWSISGTKVLLLRVDEDIIYVFSHILQHFFKGGIGLRQICDWCRLLWTYRDTFDLVLLEKRLNDAKITTEWSAFAALAVDTLGMPVEAVPLFSPSKEWSHKAEKVLTFVMESGNFGHNRDVSYYERYPYLVYKTISFWRNIRESMRHFVIFPLDATKVWWIRLKEGVQTIQKGK